MKIPKGKCIQLKPFSSIIIMEDLSIWEVIQDDDQYFVIPMKELSINIDFKEWYGEDGKANWWNDHLPVVVGNEKLMWDY